MYFCYNHCFTSRVIWISPWPHPGWYWYHPSVWKLLHYVGTLYTHAVGYKYIIRLNHILEGCMVYIAWRWGQSLKSYAINHTGQKGAWKNHAKKIKIWKRSHGSPVSIFSMHVYSFIDRLQQGVAGRQKTFPLACLELMTAGKHILRHLWTLFSTSGNAPEVSSLGGEVAGSTVSSYTTSHHVLPLLHYKWCCGTGLSLSHPLSSLCTHVCTCLHTS